jgi:hypothetical protein
MGALIAAGVITAAGAVTAASMSSAAAGKAAKAQGAAAKAAARKEKKAIKGFQKGQAQIEADLGQIQAPVYDYAAMERDALAESKYRRAQALGGEAQYEALRKQAMANISQGLAGQITDAELGAVRREQAFLQGAGFNPATAGRGAIQQRGQYDYLRAIAQTAGGAIERAGNLFGQWTNIASAYIADPKQYGALQYQYGMGAANVGLSKVGIKADLLSSMYGAQTGQAQRGYARQQENIGASLAARESQATATKGYFDAASGLVSAGAGAYSQYATAKASGIPQYSSLASAQQAAPYAGGYSQIQGMGYVPRATAV